MRLNTDRPINRAMVVGCAISATRNYLKLHMPRTLNPLLSNIHAKTRKLWKCSAMRVAASQPGAVHQSTDRPLMHSAWPPRCPLHSPGLPACGHARRLVLRLRLQSRTAPTGNPHSVCCQPVPNCPRLRALALFGRRPLQRVVSLVIPATKNLHTSRHDDGATSGHDNEKDAAVSFRGAGRVAISAAFRPLHRLI
jgi:hypothetical protein